MNRYLFISILLLVGGTGFLLAQTRRGEGDNQESRFEENFQQDYRQAGGRRRPMPSRDEFATWEVNPAFEEDVFTFVRIQYDSFGCTNNGSWRFLKSYRYTNGLRITGINIRNISIGVVVTLSQHHVLIDIQILNPSGTFTLEDDPNNPAPSILSRNQMQPS